MTTISSKSKVWSFFTRSADGKPIAKCNICKKEYKTSGNTSNLMDHMQRKHKSEWDREVPQSSTSGQKQLETYFIAEETSYDINSSRQKLLLRKLTSFIARDFQPFSVVEDAGFKEFVNALDSKFIIPSRRQINDVLLPNLYEDAKKKLINILKNVDECALTTDTWTSSNTEGYITVTCHFRNYYTDKLEAAVISTEKIEGRHTAENLKNTLNEIITRWDLQNKVSIIVTDNAANIVAAVNLLKIDHMPCFAHTINLVVKDALSTNNELKALIKRVKDIVTFFKSSTIASDKLRSLQSEKNEPELRLIQSVSTRWNSEMAMIRRFLTLREMLTIIIISLKNGPSPAIVITSNESDILSEIVDILEPFEDVTTEVSGDQYVTVSLVIPLIHGIFLKLQNLTGTIKTLIGKQVLAEIQESITKRLFPYEKRTAAIVATIVDPRFKKAFRTSEIFNNAQKYLINEIEHEIDRSVSESDFGDLQNETLEVQKRCRSSRLLSFVQNQQAPKTSTDVSTIVRQYIEMPIKNRSCNPISFWVENKTIFKSLSNVALKYLIVPATSVPSERSFSAAGEILNDRRSRLKPNKVDMLVFLQKNQFLLD